MKTKKVVSRRFTLTKTGKIMRGRQMGRHLKINKSKTQKRRMKKEIQVGKSFKKTIRKFLPYG